VRRDRGLTDFGGEIVAEMNRLGMAIDVSHCGERTSREAIAASRRPVLVTHANCAALVPGQPRCKSDQVIREMAAGEASSASPRGRFVAAGAPTIDHLLDHFEHVARVAGIEHVGLGSDLDVAPRPRCVDPWRAFHEIRGLEPRARVFQIADGLLRRGYRPSDVELVLGGNFQRALAAIWPAEPSPAGPDSAARRDPFCPAPHPQPPGDGSARGLVALRARR
jgi:membrane dipeptidase